MQPFHHHIIRQIVLVARQMDAAVPDSTIREKQAELNSLYDSFLPNTVSSMTVQTVWPMQTILPITCSVRWKSSTRTVNWNVRQICSPSGPSSPIRRWLWWIQMCIRDSHKGMIAFSKTLCKFYAQPVCFFLGNLTRAEGLAHMIGNHIICTTHSSGSGNVLPLCQKELLSLIHI